MGSLGGGEVARGKKAMLVYPKMMGANPSERWGHSACYFNGLIYIFGVSILCFILFILYLYIYIYMLLVNDLLVFLFMYFLRFSCYVLFML